MPLPIFSYRKVVNVADYGAAGTGGDYTSEINQAIDSIATSYGGWGTTPSTPGYSLTVSIPNEYVLYFPPGQYKISSPIIMDGLVNGLTIIGDNALIAPTSTAEFLDENDEETFAFQHNYCYNFKMEGMNFAGFNKAVRLYKPNVDTGMVEVRNCGFQNNGTCLELTNTSGLSRITGTKFLNSEVALDILGGDKVDVHECWIESKDGGMSPGTGTEPITHLAPIINRSRLTMTSCILVPLPPASGSIEPAWINNYLSVTVKDTRQGGETGSFTLVNNFGGVGNLLSGVVEPNSVIVKDSQCYAVYGNTETYFQPAILRYVSAIPNQTIIEHNRGLIQAQLVNFSKYLYNDDATAIQNMIQDSGAPGIVDNFNVVVKVTDNAGGFGSGVTGSLIPQALFPFVRDVNYLWPYKPTINLPLLEHTTESGTGAQLFKFEYPEDYSALMINFSADPWTQGSSVYSGGYVGILKSNGFYSNSTSGGPVREALDIQALFNYIGDTDPSSWPGGSFAVDAYWEATGDKYLPFSFTANRNFYIRVGGSDGLQDKICVAPLNAVLKGINDNFVS